MNKVAVLLSTYNGEKYVEQQINSILNQLDVEIDLFIRDDCSTDNTVNIIKNKFNQYSNIQFLKGKENLGYKKGFKYLIDYVYGTEIDYEYYSFCDQDDFWEENKLKSAIKKIEFDSDKSIPISYASNLKIVDEKLNFLKKMYEKNPIPIKFEQYLLNGYAYGCTIVLNNPGFKLIRKFNGGDKYAFDFYIPIVISMFGKNIYDENSYILYRQHESNVIGANRNLKKQLSGALFKYGVNYYSSFSREIYLTYEDIEEEKSKILKKYVDANKSIGNKIKLFKNMNVRKTTFKGTLMLKYMILKGNF